MSDCIHCKSQEISKNGKLSSGWQRRKCKDCNKQFSLWWARDSYSSEFKQKVIDQYCHTSSKAKDILQKYRISSRTLIKRKKKHIQDCTLCKK